MNDQAGNIKFVQEVEKQSINTGYFYENFRHSLNPNELTTCDNI
jgi:hypothetical protein